MAGGTFQSDLSQDRLLAAIITSSDDAIVGKTIAGIVLTWNPAAERMFGYTASEMVGKPIALLAPPGRDDEMPAILERLRSGEHIKHFETTRRHKSGAIVHVSLSVSPIVDDHGKIVGAAKIARDISGALSSAAALKAAGEQLNQQHRELLHATRLGELGEMAAILAHEINQPLSAISAYLAGCQLLIEQGRADNLTLSHAMRQTIDQVHRASEVVRRLRGYARPNDGIMQAQPIGEMVGEITGLATIDAGFRGISVGETHESKSLMVLVDRIEVQQVLLNLIRNAFEAMGGQSRRELHISSRSIGSMAEVKVSDTGSGIDNRVRERLFQPFATTKPDGMGIGLSICRKIISAHGGSLWAEDTPSGGASFIFTIPLAVEHATAPQ